MKPGPIERFLTADHARLDALLARAYPGDGTLDLEAFAEFRRGLLRHIAMEEKVLLRFAREQRGGQPLPVAEALRRDHGEIARLLVPVPTPEGCATLLEVLGRHNGIEEGPSGLYATCDALAGHEADAVVARLRAQPEVPVAPYQVGPPPRGPRREGP